MKSKISDRINIYEGRKKLGWCNTVIRKPDITKTPHFLYVSGVEVTLEGVRLKTQFINDTEKQFSLAVRIDAKIRKGTYKFTGYLVAASIVFSAFSKEIVYELRFNLTKEGNKHFPSKIG